MENRTNPTIDSPNECLSHRPFQFSEQTPLVGSENVAVPCFAADRNKQEVRMVRKRVRQVQARCFERHLGLQAILQVFNYVPAGSTLENHKLFRPGRGESHSSRVVYLTFLRLLRSRKVHSRGKRIRRHIGTRGSPRHQWFGVPGRIRGAPACIATSKTVDRKPIRRTSNKPITHHTTCRVPARVRQS